MSKSCEQAVFVDLATGAPAGRCGGAGGGRQLACTAGVLRGKGAPVSALGKAKDRAEAAKGKVKKGRGKALDDPCSKARAKPGR